MAACVPLTFSVSLPVPVPLFKELHVRKPYKIGTLPIYSIPRSATTPLTSCVSYRNTSTNRIHHRRLEECSTGDLRGSVSFHSNYALLYSTNIVLAGYWVGPDIDDGWGFIEAFVDRIA